MNLLREPSQRGQQIEPRAPHRIFRHRGRRIRIARLALRVDHFEVRRRAGFERERRDLQHFVRLLGRRAQAVERALACCAPFPARAALPIAPESAAPVSASRDALKSASRNALQPAPLAAVEDRL